MISYSLESYCPKLQHVTLCVAYLCSPDPVFQNDAKDHSTRQDRNAAEYLIKKWIIPEDVVGNDRLLMLAVLDGLCYVTFYVLFLDYSIYHFLLFR